MRGTVRRAKLNLALSMRAKASRDPLSTNLDNLVNVIVALKRVDHPLSARLDVVGVRTNRDGAVVMVIRAPREVQVEPGLHYYCGVVGQRRPDEDVLGRCG